MLKAEFYALMGAIDENIGEISGTSEIGEFTAMWFLVVAKIDVLWDFSQRNRLGFQCDRWPAYLNAYYTSLIDDKIKLQDAIRDALHVGVKGVFGGSYGY